MSEETFRRLDALYDRAFYEENLTNRAAYDALADAIAEVLPRPKPYACRVLDVGCGTGLVLARLATMYGCEVFGLDGSAAAIAIAEGLGVLAHRIDLTSGFRAMLGYGADAHHFDAVVCVEVAEHLPPEAADPLVHSLADHAVTRIVWSAAPPGQGGVDHQNEQPATYWLKRFLNRGWLPNPDLTATLRESMWRRRAQHCYARGNFHVLEHHE